MSTKVYNGYIFKSNENINFNNFYKKFIGVSDKVITEHKMSILRELYLDYIYNGKEKSLENIEFSDFDLTYSYRKELSFVVFPKYNNHFYCMIFGDANDIKIIYDEFELQEFFYYDNTDKPEGISGDNWKKRDVIWGDILGGDYKLNPNEAGLTFSISTSIFDITKSDYELFKSLTDVELLKTEIIKWKFYEQNHNGNHVETMKKWKNISSDQKSNLLNSLELNWDFKFPKSNSRLKKEIEPLEKNAINEDSLNDVILKTKVLYNNRLNEIKIELNERFSETSFEDYIDDNYREKFSEILNLKFLEEQFYITFNKLPLNNRQLDFNSQINIFKEIDINKAIYFHFLNKNQSKGK